MDGDTRVQHIIDDMQKGSLKAFDEFYRIYIPCVYRVAVNKLKDSMEAEDVCQDVFMEVLHKIDQYHP